MKFAIVTCEDCPYPAPDDQLLISALRKRSMEANRVAWSDPSVSWGSYDAAIVKSTWDYHLRYGEFMQWVEKVSSALRLFNSAQLVRWNSHKFYLSELERKGIPIVPTLFIDQSPTSFQFEWPEVVVKPAIAASAFKTIRADARSTEAGEHLRDLLSEGEALVQPYLKSVEHGEISIMAIDGKLSHTTIKRPKEGDFRVQVEHGGTIDRSEATPTQLELAERALEALEETPLFARVDLLELENGVPVLSELELIEPDLMMESFPPAAEALADALLHRIS